MMTIGFAILFWNWVQVKVFFELVMNYGDAKQGLSFLRRPRKEKMQLIQMGSEGQVGLQKKKKNNSEKVFRK